MRAKNDLMRTDIDNITITTDTVFSPHSVHGANRSNGSSSMHGVANYDECNNAQLHPTGE